MLNRRFLLTPIAAAVFATLLPAAGPLLSQAAPPPAATPAASKPATAPTLPTDKTVGKQLTAAITELTVFAHNPDDDHDFITFGITFTNTSTTDLNVDLKEVAVSLDPSAKGAPGTGLAAIISVDKKQSRGMPTSATIAAGKTSVIRYSAPGLSAANNTGKMVYVMPTFSVGNDTLSVRKSATAQPLGPKGD
jgi:hypothetical protein